MNTKWPTIKLVRRVDKEDATGKAPIVLRVTFDRKSKRVALNLQCTAIEWDAAASKFSKKLNGHKSRNEALVVILSDANKVIDDMMKESTPFTLDRFVQRYRAKDKRDDLEGYMN